MDIWAFLRQSNKICTFEGGRDWWRRGKLSKNAIVRGKRDNNRILKVQILLSRNLVVIAQAPSKIARLLRPVDAQFIAIRNS